MRACRDALVLLSLALTSFASIATERDPDPAGATPATPPTETTPLAVATDPSGPAIDNAGAPTDAGMRVYRDPETGALTSRPTDAQRRALDTALEQDERFSNSTDGLRQFTLPNGAVGIDLGNRFQSTVTVTVDPAGGRQFECDQPLHRKLDAASHRAQHGGNVVERQDQ